MRKTKKSTYIFTYPRWEVLRLLREYDETLPSQDRATPLERAAGVCREPLVIGVDANGNLTVTETVHFGG